LLIPLRSVSGWRSSPRASGRFSFPIDEDSFHVGEPGAHGSEQRADELRQLPPREPRLSLVAAAAGDYVHEN
jgi:hypothetical protein